MKKRVIKRIFSIILAVIFFVQMIPLSIVRADFVKVVMVNGVDIITNPGSMPAGVSFNELTDTLTLNNVDLTGSFQTGDLFAGIYTNIDLNIILIGDNDITIGGMDVTKNYTGIYAENSNLNFNGSGSLVVTGTNYSIAAIGSGGLNGDITFNDSVKVSTYGELKASSMGATIHGIINVKNEAEVRYYNMYMATNGFACDPTAIFENGNNPIPNPGPNPGGSFSFNTDLHIDGKDLLESPSPVIPGITVSDLTADSVTITLENVTIDEGIADGDTIVGFYAKDRNVNLILIGDNIIKIPTSGMSVSLGIYTSDSSITMSGTGTLKVYGDNNSIFLNSSSKKVDLTISQSVNVEAYGEVFIGAMGPDEGNLMLIDDSVLTIYGGYFLSNGNMIIEDNARYNPEKFIIGGETVIPDVRGLTESEVVIDEGAGWSIKALGGINPDTLAMEYNLSLNIDNYNGPAIYCYNYDGFINFSGTNQIDKDVDGYSLHLLNSNTQIWESFEVDPDSDTTIYMAGGIELFYAEFMPWYCGDWYIGSESEPSPKGIVGIGGINNVSFTRDNLTVFSESEILKGINDLIIEDDANLLGNTSGNPVDMVSNIKVATSGKIDINYNNGGVKITDDLNLLNTTFFYKSKAPLSASDVFPESRYYEVNCLDNTYLFFKDDIFGSPDISIMGDPVNSEDIKYSLTDDGSRYLFESISNRITRIFADDDGQMEGGTIEVVSINGYNFGGYVAEIGMPVLVRVIPDKGYQYKPGSLLGTEGLLIEATDELGVYTFIMPGNTGMGVALSCEFVKTDDIVTEDSKFIKNLQISNTDKVINNGNSRFIVMDSKLTSEELKGILEKAGNYIPGAVLDLTLEEIITKNGSTEDVWSRMLSELVAKVNIDFNLEDSLKGHGVYSVARIHNNQIQIIECKYVDGKLSFDTDMFSKYVVLYSDTASNPNTSDRVNIIWYSAFIITSATGYGYCKFRRRRINE